LQGWEIVLIDSSSGEVSRIHGPGWQSVPTWSASGDQLAYTVSVADDASVGGEQPGQWIAIYSISGSTERRIQCDTCSNPVWLPEGRILVDLSVRQESDTSWQAASASLDPLKGSLDEPIPYEGMPNLEVALQNGNSLRMHGPYVLLREPNAILMTAYDHGCRGVWIYRTGSNGPQPLIDSSELDECDPALSVDGSQLLYTVKPPGSFAPTTIMIAGPDGSSPVIFLEPGGDPFQARHPTWSPDGTRIAFVYGVFHETAPAYSTIYIAEVPSDLLPPRDR
jgi:Tol biopolymer transport system component